MKLQLTKDKTIDIRMPWEKSAPAGTGASARKKGLMDVVGVELTDDPAGCPAVRLRHRKDGWHLVAAGRVPAPEGHLPETWEETGKQPQWALPAAFQAPHAALVVASAQSFIRQTTPAGLVSDPYAAKTASEAAPRKLGIRREAASKPAEAEKPMPRPQAGIPLSHNGTRSVMLPLADDGFALQCGLPEFQVLWLSRLLPEGHRPTAASVQIREAALLSAPLMQPAFREAGGNAAAVFVLDHAVFFAAYREGTPILFRECPDVGGSADLRKGVGAALGLEDAMIDSVLDDTLLDPRPALEPYVRPVLRQLALSLDYLRERHNLTIGAVLVFGLSAGARYWSQMCEDSLHFPLLAPEPFEGLVKATGKKKNETAEISPSEASAFLAALGAARSAMEAK